MSTPVSSAPPHVDQCPGCVADRLTEPDRVRLRSSGAYPKHVLVPPPRLAPPPREALSDARCAGCQVASSKASGSNRPVVCRGCRRIWIKRGEQVVAVRHPVTGSARPARAG
jgi:hypothetical protein